MSHNIVVKGVRIKDTDLLAKIVTEMSKGAASLDMTAKLFRTERMLGGTNPCDGTINLPGSYDIGLHKTGDSFSLTFPPGISRVLAGQSRSNPIGGAMQEYALREAEYAAAQDGRETNRIAGKNGTVTLEVIQAA